MTLTKTALFIAVLLVSYGLWFYSGVLYSRNELAPCLELAAFDRDYNALVDMIEPIAIAGHRTAEEEDWVRGAMEAAAAAQPQQDKLIDECLRVRR
jgi:hypothetical protein